MIIQPVQQGLLFITQPDHAQLAGAVMQHAEALRGHSRAASVLLAVGEHDNGWAEADAAPQVGTDGRPYDFVSLPLESRHGVWPRGIARLATAPWAAALVAHHALTVYDRYRADRAWDRFFGQMTALRGEMLASSGGTIEDLLADYPFLRLGDLISLVFCTGMSEEQRFDEWLVRRSEDTVYVTPDPFGGEIVDLEITGRMVPAVRYGSDDELRAALAAAPRQVLRGTVRAVGPSSVHR